MGNARWVSSIHADRLFVWNKVYTSNQTVPIEDGGTGATIASTALANLGAIPATRTINSKALNSNIKLNCTDVDAAPYESKSDADFNEMTTLGLYTMRSSTTNAPTSGSYHSVIVNKSDDGNYVQQIAIKESSYDIYIRYLSGSSWSNWVKIKTDKDEINIDKVYPVGSIYISVNSTNPSSYFGGTWVSWDAGRVPVGVNTSDSNFSTVEKIGGEQTHTLIG